MSDSDLMRPKPKHSVSQSALRIEMSGMTKRFGSFTALDNVSMVVEKGTFHALLGENGAGKSTLVKCLVGYYQPDEGQISVDNHEVEIRSPQDARDLGIGMVYQHFTLVPSMTVAENLVMSRADVPAFIRWRYERERLAAFMATVPFKVPLERVVSRLSAGEKQKVEIVKQLYLKQRFMILDEPTSVLTPDEADEVLGMLHGMTREHLVTVLMITHKFREVMAFADEVTVLRRGAHAGGGLVKELDAARMAEMMVGSREIPHAHASKTALLASAPVMVDIHDLVVDNDAGLTAVSNLSMTVHAGEIVGVAGVAGNGQRELVEALVGQRRPTSGTMTIGGIAWDASRSKYRIEHVFALPEEPLRNACVPKMSVAQNMALRNFDRAPAARGPWLVKSAVDAQAKRWIEGFGVKTRDAHTPIGDLSGGNVQRAVLARELSDHVSVLIASDPVFGLDFAAVAEIHDRIVAARNGGAAVLLVSGDLDELLELSDRIVVMFEGKIVHEAVTAVADRAAIGRCMAGHEALAA
jgi:general nucleoside transport system ATP-binding protein